MIILLLWVTETLTQEKTKEKTKEKTIIISDTFSLENKIIGKICHKSKAGISIDIMPTNTVRSFHKTSIFETGITHPTCDVLATSHLGLIKVETSRNMLRRHHDVATGT